MILISSTPFHIKGSEKVRETRQHCHSCSTRAKLTVQRTAAAAALARKILKAFASAYARPVSGSKYRAGAPVKAHFLGGQATGGSAVAYSAKGVTK